MARRISLLTVMLTTMALLLTLVAAGSVTATKKDKKGGEGCTPGYWKQSQHFDSWTAPYDPTDDFDATFGVNLFSPNVTLLGALEQGGGGKYALGRHATAALLNAASGGVDYGMTTAQVIAAVQAANLESEWEPLKDIFEALNQSGCPLN